MAGRIILLAAYLGATLFLPPSISVSQESPAEIEQFCQGRSKRDCEIYAREFVHESLGQQFKDSIANYPDGVKQELMSIRDKCEAVDDTIAPLATFVHVMDLNADRSPDFAIDQGGSCLAGLEKSFCDSTGQCAFQVWLSKNSVTERVLNEMPMMPSFSLQNGDYLLTLEYLPERCGMRSNETQACVMKYLFSSDGMSRVH